ncbi:MAG: hypothetical protein ACI8UR_000101 [Natronomonas sp.]|jgi:hypothetical protein|uniref:hypothetical protein n=1 Tax=Natronomonas sp. TaxID=2184060 RepID=UPI003988CC96
MSEKKPNDTENKTPWLEFGEQREETFIDIVAPKLGLDVERNPRKDADPTVLDLLVDGSPADLKTQETPFFTARRNYDLPPQFTVTFNQNDHQRYLRKDDPDIYFWVRWRDELEGYGAEVGEMEGVWRIAHSDIEALVDTDEAPLHHYKRRHGDAENANASYLLRLDEMERLACFVGPC